jgi:peptidoglycan hydrolase-like protein with peptidoglycan-binding domain
MLKKTKELQQALKDANLYKGPIDGIFRADRN